MASERLDQSARHSPCTGSARTEKTAIRCSIAAAHLALPAQASPTSLGARAQGARRAQAIRAQLDARYRALPGRGLAVTEATLHRRRRVVHAPDAGPARATLRPRGRQRRLLRDLPGAGDLPVPGTRFARPAADLVTRRLALELALRTFLQTLPMSSPSRFPPPASPLCRRADELAREVDLPALAKALDGDPSRTLSRLATGDRRRGDPTTALRLPGSSRPRAEGTPG